MSTEAADGTNPEDLRYTAEHEWVGPADDDGVVRVGVTDYAQAALGDIVFVSLPAVGDEVAAGSPCGELESTKSVSDIYAPVDGLVVDRNEALDANPELVNVDAYGDGWLFSVRPADPGARDELLDAAGYRATIGEG